MTAAPLVLLLAALVRTATAGTNGFSLQPALRDCPAICKGFGLKPLPAGPPSLGKFLCGRNTYGVWANGTCSLIDNGAVATPDTYDCGCRLPGPKNAPNWQANTACLLSSGPGPVAKPVCRVSNQAGTDFQLGWLNKGSSTCYFAPAPFGKNGAVISSAKPGQANMQVLCNGPGTKAYAAAATKQVVLSHGHPDCRFTCGAGGPVDGGGGPGKALCALNASGIIIYGESDYNVVYSNVTTPGAMCGATTGVGSTLTEDFLCACKAPQPEAAAGPFGWAASPRCARGTNAAATEFAICRLDNPLYVVGKPDTGPPWLFGSLDYRSALPVPHRPPIPDVIKCTARLLNGSVLSASAFGGPSNMQALCRLSDQRGCQVPGILSTRAGLAKLAGRLAAKGSFVSYAPSQPFRWQGIREEVCPGPNGPVLPAYADTSSFVYWLYWTVLGGGSDLLGNTNWKGKPSTASEIQALLATGQPAGLFDLQPGDLVFWDKDSSTGQPRTVGLYLGKDVATNVGQVAVLERPLLLRRRLMQPFYPVKPRLLPLGSLPTYVGARTYPDMLLLDPIG